MSERGPVGGEHGTPPGRTPPLRATYRLQFHAGFTLGEAAAVVPYLQALGVSHVYASPLLRTRRGSTHGYDVVDPTQLNPELGGEGDRRALDHALATRDMGLVLDIVPNHMAVSDQNRAWWDVLRHGRASPTARWFDIDWYTQSEEVHGRILLPVLGSRLREAMAKGELSLRRGRSDLVVAYYESTFPLDPLTWPRVLGLGLDAARERARAEGNGSGADALDELAGLLERLRRAAARRAMDAEGRERRRHEALHLAHQILQLAEGASVRALVERALADFPAGPAGPARLRRLLDRQHYALVYWRRSALEINYRRFFNIDELVALRMEDPQVFAQTHELVLEWVRDGFAHALRVDHVDGLRDPLAYLQRLRAALDERRPAADPARRMPVFVEKILSPGEQLREEWPVAGTTGYETLNDLEAVFIDAAGAARIEAHYRAMLRLDERGVRFADVARDGKRAVLRHSLAADVQRLVKLFVPIARRDPRTAGHSRDAIATAIVETIVHLGVYRTYVAMSGGAAHSTGDDARWVDAAIRGARGTADGALLDLLYDVLLLGGPRSGNLAALAEVERVDRVRFATRFQQVSGPATGKGVEDTALYLYVPLLSRNEVGGEPDRPLEDAVAELHEGNARRAAHWPRAMVTTSTHDTKRGADTRARLDVLSEIPDDWWGEVARWRRLNAPLRARVGRRWAPDPNTEYLLYQTLVGIWPVPDVADAGAPSLPGTEALAELRERAAAYMEKAVREGKSRSSWVSPNTEFEGALAAFIAATLDPERSAPFITRVSALARRIAAAGHWNGLARTLLHLTAPGVPDLYQGTELWDFTLEDPDNRRPVDFALRSGLLDSVTRAYRSGSADELRGYLRELVGRPGDGRVKLAVTHRALVARREAAALFESGGYVPLTATGARASHVVAYARVAGGEAAVVVVPRLSLGSSGGAPPVGESVLRVTLLPLPGGFATRWRCQLSRGTVQVGRDGLPLAQVLAELPVALLRPEPA
jgi:(1->4)-alpha-D-glucan 1-alpha-D-glucosylmutase